MLFRFPGLLDSISGGTSCCGGQGWSVISLLSLVPTAPSSSGLSRPILRSLQLYRAKAGELIGPRLFAKVVVPARGNFGPNYQRQSCTVRLGDIAHNTSRGEYGQIDLKLAQLGFEFSLFY